MKAVFERIATKIVAMDRAEQREVGFETQHAVRTVGAPYYTEVELAARRERGALKRRLAGIMYKAAAQERARIESRDGKRPWPPMLRWPFNVVA